MSEGRKPNAIADYYRSAQHDESRPPAPRPWLLAALAVVCAALVVVGSLGPWTYEEIVSDTETASSTSITPGFQTDGAFSLLFAVAATVTLSIAMLKEEAGHVAWIAFAAMASCAMIGLFGWFIFGPQEQTLEPGEAGAIVRIEWGVKLVGLAGAAGATTHFIIARRLNQA